ncbi:MAG: flagellar basal body P-ring formation protein FlgA [bacterium]|jgi:flagella basal body P-ring formation protein FlgA
MKVKFGMIAGVLAAVLAAHCALPAAAAGIIIHLHREAVIEGPYIELSEIAEIDAPQDRLDEIKDLRLGIAPALGREFLYRRTDLISRLNFAGYAESEYSVTGADSVLIKRAGTSISGKSVAEFLESEIKSRFGESAKVVWKTKLPDLQVRQGEVELKLSYPSGREGALPISILICADGSLVGQHPLSRYAAFKVPIVLALETIPRGAEIAPGMIDCEVRTLPPGRPVVSTIAECIGLEAKRTIGAGEEISPDSLLKPFDVCQGDSVSVRISRGAVDIETEGTAMESGYLGDRILVRIGSTGRSLRGILAASGFVLVTFDDDA